MPNINNKNHALRSFGERAAINAPIQGLASDIIKMAMVRLDKEFTLSGIKPQMILQIHDELIFDTVENEVEQVSKIIKSVMENVFILDVPLKVDIHTGNNWQDAH